MRRKKVELLAPAGNAEGFYGAIHAGADAVYLGGGKFGARAYADNFNEEELVNCIRYAHILGRRVYLTVNTMVKESEFPELYEYLLPYYETGLDGVIIQDLGVLLYLREQFPGMELHASTQMTVTGKYASGWLKELGVCRIVPARELSLTEIHDMKEATGLEIETFIHGAMCYCYSGQCLFSSILGGRSGNRGRCAQPCRLPYTIIADGQNSRECYPLSLKDMCTIEHLPELIESGIDSFKIEGRMKKPEYTAGVTGIYRKYIDAYYAHPDQKQHIAQEDLEALSCLYIRSGRQDGYYYKHNGADMVTLDSPAYSGSDEALLGRIRSRYLEQKLKLKADLFAVFRLGEPAQLTMIHNTTSVTVSGDCVSAAQKQPVSQENIEKQLRKLGDTIFEAGELSITLDDNIFYHLKAINELRRQAVKLLEEELIRQSGLCVKREIPDPEQSEILTKKPIQEIHTKQYPDNDEVLNASAERKGLVLSVRTLPQLQAVCRLIQEEGLIIKRVYLDGDLFPDTKAVQDSTAQNKAAQWKETALSLAENTELYLAMPYILRKRDDQYLKSFIRTLTEKGFSGCMVRSLEGYAYLKEACYQGKIASDAGIYIWNLETLRFWQKRLNYFCLPLELNAREQKALLSAGFNDSAAFRQALPEKLIYGRIPMMITANCAAKTAGHCHNGSGGRKTAELCDRYQKHFPVEINCSHCMNIIYNSVPLSLHSDCRSWKETADLRLDFTLEDEVQTDSVIRYFTQLLEQGIEAAPPYSEFTKGHEKRGVE